MSDIPNLKLINAVDPTKIKVTINEKFSKLTLSSNKKRNNEPVKTSDPKEVEKRQSASRNLLEDLVDNNANSARYSNAILRSSSSSISIRHDDQNETEITETQMDDVHNDSKVTQSSMEALQISDDNELADLTQGVSNLTVGPCAGVVKNETLHKTMSFAETEIIDLDTDTDVSEEESEEESIICVSDSDDENLPHGQADEYNLMITSDLVSSGQTGEPELPCTLSNERADRIEAFLHDVSQEQRNILATGGGLAEDSFMVHLPTPTDNVENVLRDSFKAKRMATADTESMKTNTESMRPSTDSRKLQEISLNDDNTLKNNSKAKRIANADTESMETNTESTRPSDGLQGQRKMTLDDTEPINESADVSFLSHLHQNINDDPQKHLTETQSSAARRLANDDTEANTSLESGNDTVQESDQSQAHIAPEESIVISETSCEESNASDENLSAANGHALIPSEEILSSSIRQGSDDSDSASTQIGLSMGSINISAKINIKLQIRTNLSLSDENNSGGSSDAESQQSSAERPKDDENDDADSIIELNDNEENDIGSKASSEFVGEEKQAFKNDYNPEPCTPKPNSNMNALSNAEKLLTELYGQAWQTPDILKILKGTNDTENVNKNCAKTVNDGASKSKKLPKPKNTEESQPLDDFSTFRINIEKTNMDSTRLVTPKPKNTTKKRTPREVQTEPRQKKNIERNTVRNAFKTPQTAFKKKPPKPVNDRWRRLIDDDSEPEQNDASDDDHIEKTILTDDNSESDNEDAASNASDSSWNALTEEEESETDEVEKVVEKKPQTQPKIKTRGKNKQPKDNLIYMDLSKDEVSIVQQLDSPPANHDENFQQRLSELLDDCRYEERPKLEATPKSIGKSKRRLFTPNFGYEDTNDDNCKDVEKALKEINLNSDNKVEDAESVRFNGVLIPPSFNIFNKRLESVKTGKPVYKITPPRKKEPRTPIATREETTPFKTPQNITTPRVKPKHKLDELCSTPSFKYSFLKSLDVCVGKSMCHPDALEFRENYRQKKEDLAKILYELYNSKLFKNDLNVPIQWNKKLLNTAGRCLNKKKAGQRLSVVELSDKVLTSADRLRCTLIHELCHAATWVFNGEGGHGATWKEWARKANMVFPDLPKIGVCHQYDIEYKYTYKCMLCGAKSYYHSKSKKVENIRCSYCYGAIEIFLNKKDKEGNVMPTPVREPTGFAKFVKEKYKQYKRPNLKHAEVMKLLSNEYAALKVSDKGK